MKASALALLNRRHDLHVPKGTAITVRGSTVMLKIEDLATAQLALESAPFGVMLVDSERRIAYANSAAQTILASAGLKAARPDLGDLPRPVIAQLFRPEANVDFKGPDGQTRSLHCACSAVAGSDSTLHYLHDVTELSAITRDRDSLAEELARLSTRDSLTSLPNHKALWQALEPLISRSRRYENPLTVVRLRIDTATELDSAHGTGTHDAVMVGLAQTLRDQVRWADLVGRFDDSEFLLILPETSADAAQNLVDKLRERIAELRFPSTGGEQFAIAPLFGVASWQKGDDGRLLLKRANERLSREPKGAAA